MPKGAATEWAYTVKLVSGRLVMNRILTASSTHTPVDAVKIVGNGETATILAHEMSKFNTLWEGKSVAQN